MPRKHLCSCGAHQYQGEVFTMSRTENKGGINHEFEEKLNIWICEFCGKEEKILISATRRSKGIKSPRRFIVTQYASALIKIPISHDHIRTRTFIKILEEKFPERTSEDILEDMLLEGIVQVDYTMRNAKRDPFIPMRVRLNPNFKNWVREILEDYKGIEPIEEKIKRVKTMLLSVNYSQAVNPQSKKILTLLKNQQKFLSNEKVPYFDCGTKKCQIKRDNKRYEILLTLLLALLDNVRKETFNVSTDFCHSLDFDGICLSEYRLDLESTLGAKLIFFGILRDIVPLYIPPCKIPKETYSEIELFEIDLRNFIKANLLSFYTNMQTVIYSALKATFRGKSWNKINKKMIKDLESDYEKSKDPSIKNAINLAKQCRPYNQLLFDRFFEAMVMGDLVIIIENEWNLIFSGAFKPLKKNDVLTKLKTIKEDRNIKSHPISKIPTTFKTLTYIYEFKSFISEVE